MSARERVRLDAMHRVERGEITVAGAAELMGLSPRQAKRVRKRFKAKGAAGLVHRLRSKPGNRRLPEELRERIVKRHQERYWDFGPTLASEKLAEDGLAVSPDTLVALMAVLVHFGKAAWGLNLVWVCIFLDLSFRGVFLHAVFRKGKWKLVRV